jgi:hypothetical protein
VRISCITERLDSFFFCRQNPRRSTFVDLSEECSATVFGVAELASSCAAKLLNARAEQHVNLPWPSFLELYNETSTFNINSEILCRTMIIAIRGAVNSQVRHHLNIERKSIYFTCRQKHTCLRSTHSEYPSLQNSSRKKRGLLSTFPPNTND